MSKRLHSQDGLSQRILERLKASSFWTEKTRISGNTIQGLICPACEDREAWAYIDGPMSINCNRGKKCGATTKTLELFPELRLNVERDFPATKEDPHRPAREYLRARGLPDAILADLTFKYHSNARNTGSGAVLFVVGKDEKGKEILNGRLFNPPPGQGKTHNIGSTAGRFWHHPGQQYDANQPTFITEGILDALSLLAMGIQAIAVLAAGQDPGKVDLSAFPYKVLSFDNDEAGHQACRKWRMRYPEADIVLCDPGQDWNDLLVTGTTEQAKQLFEANLPRYRNHGRLTLAESAQQWAELYHEFHHYPPGLFVFRKETHYATLKTPRGSDQQPFVNVERCTKAAITVVSYTIDRANPARPGYRYNLEVQPSQQGRPPVQVTATGKDIATARAMNEFLLSNARINWEGDSKATTALQNLITENKKAPEVRLLSVTGYQPENKAYIFHHWAVDTTGKIITPDKRGFFQLSHKQYFQPPAHSESKAIAPADIGTKKVKAIYRLISEAWGFNGVAALSWVVAGWFVNQIKEKENFFPFLSLWGDPASGKSALTTLLNTIQGREGEGLPVTALNSKKGSIRTIGQVSGLFTALLEDNERNERGFDYSIILTAYNKGPLQVQAAFSNDLQTKENPFLGTLLFCQNIEPFNSEPEKQRTISLHFKTDAITDESRAAYDKLAAMSKNELAGVLQQVLAQRSHFESDWPKEFIEARAKLGTMEERRILDNHALILAFHRIFCRLFSIEHTQDIALFLGEIGRKKCVSSAVRQIGPADYFFECLNAIEVRKNETDLKDHNGRDLHPYAYHTDTKTGRLYVNVPACERALRDRSFPIQVNAYLLEALQKHPAFIANSIRYRFPFEPFSDKEGRPKQRRVWAFRSEWFDENEPLTGENEPSFPDGQATEETAPA